MGPSDYRHNPFTDVSTAVQVTEVYRIPSVSPYTIQLNEVPVKSNPSTMTVKVLNVSGTSISEGVSFTEVAANPSANQFFPDYNTAADGDVNWNTGKLLFSSANAGGLVQITYQAKGTLASVRANRDPNNWVDLGDGSDGDFRPSSDIVLTRVVKNYKSIIIPAGVTVTIDIWSKLKCQGACVVKGTIRVLGGEAGATVGENSPGKNGTASFGGGVAGDGGSGGLTTGSTGSSTGGTGGKNPYLPAMLFTWGSSTSLLLSDSPFVFYGGGGGSGGRGYDTNASDTNNGAGGRGGGYFRLVAKSVWITGSINASGGDGGYGKRRVGGGGGGGGGVVVVIGHELIGTGNITVAGGAGGGNYADGQPGTAGAAGLVATKQIGWS